MLSRLPPSMCASLETSPSSSFYSTMSVRSMSLASAAAAPTSPLARPGLCSLDEGPGDVRGLLRSWLWPRGSVTLALCQLRSSFFTGVLAWVRLLRGLSLEGPLLIPVEMLSRAAARPVSPCLKMSTAQSSPSLVPLRSLRFSFVPVL